MKYIKSDNYYLSIPLLLFSMFCLFTRQCLSQENILVMHDGGPDDFGSLILIACQNNFNIEYIDVTPAASYKQPAALVTKQCLDYLHAKQTVISANDFDGTHLFPKAWRNDAQTLSKLPIFNNTKKIASNQIFLTNATMRLTNFLSGRGKYTLLITGPFSNLAESIKMRPSIINNIKRIYAMGGAIMVNGNVIVNEHILPAEWNIYNNPQAADIVFRSGIPITLIPLDVTNRAPVSRGFLQRLYSQRSSASKLVSAIYQMVESVIEDKIYFWDVLAAAALIDPKLFQTEPMNISVVLTGEAQGQTLESHNGTPLDVATEVDLKKFQGLMFSSLQRCKQPKKLQGNINIKFKI